MSKKKQPTIDPQTGEPKPILSVAVKPIVTGFTVTCPKCKDTQEEKVSRYAPGIEVGAYECPKCKFSCVLNPPLKVGGARRRYL